MVSRSRFAYSQLIRNRSFMALWVGQAISFIGDYFYYLAIPILVNKLTGSTLLVGLSTIANTLPILLLGPVAGVFVDRWERKIVMITSDLLRAILVLGCLLVHSPQQVWIYFLVGFLMSCVSRFFYPAQSASLPGIVKDPHDLLAANGMMQAVQTVGLLVGPALAGFTIGLWGEWVAFIFDSGSFLFSALAITLMAIPALQREEAERSHLVKDVTGEIRAGLSFLFHNRVLVPMVVNLVIVYFGLGAISVLWVPYLQRVFNIGAAGLGLVNSMQGAGMLLGGLSLGFISGLIKKRIPLAALGLLGVGASLSVMGLAPAFGFLMAASLGMGFSAVPAVSVLSTFLQIVPPDSLRGRVSSAVEAMGVSVQLISMAVAAFIGDLIGFRTIYLLCGVIVIAAAVLTRLIGKEPDEAQAVTAAEVQ